MSYLDIPRIHISGQFFTDPSTVNNDPTHYDPAVTRPSPWQEPNGQHRFQLKNCLVMSAVDANGPVATDYIIGAPISSYDQNPCRIVDLDVYQQGVSSLIGMQLIIGLDANTTIQGTMDTAVLNDCWFNAVLPTRSWGGDYGEDSFGGDMNAAGIFQTVVRFDQDAWPETTQSNILNQLRSTTLVVNNQLLVSFKFVMDGYENVPQNTNYQLGRLTGTLGPVFANEPLYNSGQRVLQPRTFATTDPWYSPSFNTAYFKVDSQRSKLIVDLANSICRQSAGGPPVDLGTLTAEIMVVDAPAIVLGEIDYTAFAYSNNAQIAEISISHDFLSMAETNPLLLVSSRTDLGATVVLSESSAGGPDFAVEVRTQRMPGDTGTTATTQVYISQNGQPLAGKQLALFVESVHGNTPGATVPPTNPGDTPQADGALTATITASDEFGFATVTLTVVKDPGYRTPLLDGQLYFIIAYDPEQPVPDWSTVAPIQSHLISCVAFSQYPVNENPTWDDVQAILAPYIKLYPAMTAQINLSDPQTFFTFANNPPWSHGYNYYPTNPPLGITAGAIPYYLIKDFTDPQLMPISRDLSPNRLMTILYYIKNLQDGTTSINS
jgi:hypothetical protein